MSAQRSRMLAQVVAHASAGLGKALAMRQQPPLPGLVASCRRRHRRRPLSRRSSRSRPRARSDARLAGRGPAPRSRTAPSRERCMGCRRGSHSRRRRRRACRCPRRHLPPPPRRDASRRRRRRPRHRRSPASPTCVTHLRHHRHRPRHRRSPNCAAAPRPVVTAAVVAIVATVCPASPRSRRHASPRRHRRCRRRRRRRRRHRSLSPSSSPLCVAPTARPRAAAPCRPCRLAIAATLHVTPAALPRCCATYLRAGPDGAIGRITYRLDPRVGPLHRETAWLGVGLRAD